jgi:hypothetical protein
MRIVPEHKQDFDACSALAVADDSTVISQLHELLAWLQDMSWPVAQLVEARIKSLGVPLVTPVREVLRGTDNVWKFWLVASLLHKVSPAVVALLQPELSRIVSSPLIGEIEEGVVDAVLVLVLQRQNASESSCPPDFLR